MLVQQHGTASNASWALQQLYTRAATVSGAWGATVGLLIFEMDWARQSLPCHARLIIPLAHILDDSIDGGETFCAVMMRAIQTLHYCCRSTRQSDLGMSALLLLILPNPAPSRSFFPVLLLILDLVGPHMATSYRIPVLS